MNTAITGGAIGFIVWAVIVILVCLIPPVGVCWRKTLFGSTFFAGIGAAIGWLVS